jgi:SAM-dependent methyltransferase
MQNLRDAEGADRLEYHRRELQIAKSADDPRRVMPVLRPTDRAVLDIGCGAGQTLLGLELPAGVLGAGVDVDVDALVLGRQLDAEGRLLFAAASGEALPFTDATFDFVICRVALPYMHIERAVGSMARVLKPGGDVWLVLHPWRLVAGSLAAALRAGAPRAVLGHAWVLLSGVLLHATGRQFRKPFGRPGYESFQTARTIRRALGMGGFDRIHIRTGEHFVVTARRSMR